MKHKTTKILSVLLTLVMLLSVASGCTAGSKGEEKTQAPQAGTTAPSATPQATQAVKTKINVAALMGPTGMGMVKLMADNEAGLSANDYTFTLTGAPEDIVGRLTSGEVDIAAVPTNLAATLYNKTSGKIQILALNTLGVLYIVENGDTIKSVADLAGKTIIASGQGSTPEFILNYILEANGIDGKVTVEYKTEHSEVAALIAAGQATVALLPEPFVTSTLLKTQGTRAALDLTDEFTKANKLLGRDESVVSMGCLVVRNEFVQNNKAALDAFLTEYKASAEFAAENPGQTAALIVKYGIMANEAAALKALPNCHIVYIDGEEMKSTLPGFLMVLFEANPASIGGSLPGEGFYYQR
ncbi:MAG: ABC transporter substrate-binding protein [Christensenellales bacterium]